MLNLWKLFISNIIDTSKLVSRREGYFDTVDVVYSESLITFPLHHLALFGAIVMGFDQGCPRHWTPV